MDFLGNLNSSTITIITWILCGLITAILISSIYSRKKSYENQIPVKPLTSLSPSAVISLGILGTFLGIYLGLRNFNTADIYNSIPELLEGLKTAFITSLFGMLSSLILKYIFGKYEEKGIESSIAASDDPIIILQQISKGISTLSNTMLRCFSSDEDFSLISQLKIIRTDINDLKREITKSLDEFGKKVAELGTKAMIEALREVIGQFNARLNDLVGEEFKQLKEAMIKLTEWQDKHRVSVDQMQNSIDGYLEQVKSSTALLGRAASSIGNSSDSLDSIDGSLSTISVSADDIEKHIEHLKLQNNELLEFIQEINKMGEEAKSVLPSISKHIQESTEMLVKASENANNRIVEVGNTLEGTMNKTHEKMGQMIETHKKQTDDTIEQIQKNLEKVISISLNSLAGQLASLSNKFVEDYTPLTNQLRNVVHIAGGIKHVTR